MVIVAHRPSGELVIASDYDERAWDALKLRHVVGDFIMECCDSPAIPKTSLNGRPFFAHHSGECATAPESKWHKQAKALIETYAGRMGLVCKQEYSEKKKGKRKWQADIYFECGARRIVIELQHSYQGLPKYQERQERYLASGIECYWLLYPKCYKALVKKMGQKRFSQEFGGVVPKTGFLPCLQGIPIACLEGLVASPKSKLDFKEDDQEPLVKGAGRLLISTEQWLASVIEQRFRWDNGAWVID